MSTPQILADAVRHSIVDGSWKPRFSASILTAASRIARAAQSGRDMGEWLDELATLVVEDVDAQESPNQTAIRLRRLAMPFKRDRIAA